MTTNPEEALAALGFTETEARIYCELLRGGPATGYRLAQAIGKAPANTYQALSVLAQKGAVLVDDGDTKTHRAAPPEELLAGLKRGFDARREDAQAALAGLGAPMADDRIYQLRTPAQTYERARAMIAAAREVVLFDAFPGPLAELTPELTAAAARGVIVAGLTYGAATGLPFLTVDSHGGGLIGERWPGQQLSLVADAVGHLIVLLSPDGERVKHGVWSDSAYLACIKHSGLAAEIRLSVIEAGDADVPDLSLLRAYPAGLRRLIGPAPTVSKSGDAT